MIPNLFAFVAVTILAQSSPMLTETKIEPENGAFDAVRIGRWTADVETSARHEKGEPLHIRDITCSASSDNVRLFVYRNGNIMINFHGDGYSILNIDQISIGRKTFDAKRVSLDLSTEFSNIDYHHPADEIWTGAFHGYLSVKLGGGPWVPSSYLINDILKVNTVGIRYRRFVEKTSGGNCTIDDDQSKGCWAHHIGRADVTGLRQVVNWCQTAMASDAALIYRGQ